MKAVDLSKLHKLMEDTASNYGAGLIEAAIEELAQHRNEEGATRILYQDEREKRLAAEATIQSQAAQLAQLNKVAANGMTTLELLDGWNEANKKCQSQAAEIERLKGALEPFLREVEQWNEVPGLVRYDDSLELWQVTSPVRTKLTVGDLRALRQALASTKPQDGEA